MALDFVIFDGDQVNFLPACGGANVIVKPGKMKASGKTTIKGKKVCVEGDEKNVNVSGCTYMTPAFPIPGNGNLKIKQLVPNQLTQKATSGNKRIILKGQLFIAQFEVTSPAKQPPPANTPDPVPFYIGQGKLVPGNSKVKAS